MTNAEFAEEMASHVLTVRGLSTEVNLVMMVIVKVALVVPSSTLCGDGQLGDYGDCDMADCKSLLMIHFLLPWHWCYCS